MKTLILIYNPIDWNNRSRALPVAWEVFRHTRDAVRLQYILEYPGTHIVLKIHGDEAGTMTQTTIAGLKIEFEEIIKAGR